MPNLTDYIEEYLKRLLALSSDRYIEIRRRELAGKFTCVPSQINYVLQRRFSPERGYLVESKRGGGGCIRIYRIDAELMRSWREVIAILREGAFDPDRAGQLLQRLDEERVISKREYGMLEVLMRDKTYYDAGITDQSCVRKLQQGLLGEALEEMLKAGY